MRRWLLLGLIAAALAGGTWLAVRAPAAAAQRIRAALERRLEALDLRAEVGPVQLTWRGEVRIADVSVSDTAPAGPSLDIGEISARAANWSVIERRTGIADVSLHRVRALVPDPAAAAAWIRQLGERAGPTQGADRPDRPAGGTPFRLDLQPLPSVDISDLAVDSPVGALKDCHGQLRNEALTTDALKVAFKVACGFAAGERWGRLAVEGRYDREEERLELRADLEPPLSIDVAGATVSLGSLRRTAEGRILLGDVSLITPHVSASVGRFEASTRDGQRIETLALRVMRGDLAPAAAVQRIAEVVADDMVVRGGRAGGLSERIRAALEGALPQILKTLPVSADTAPGDERPAKKRKRRRRTPKVHDLLVDTLAALQPRMDSALAIPKKIYDLMPVDRLQVKRASIDLTEAGAEGARPPDEDAVADAFDLLHHITAAVTREDGTLRGRLTFRTPATGDDTNEITLRVDPAGPALQGEARLKRVPVEPYQALLPSWLEPGPAATLRDVELLFSLDGATRHLRLEGKIGVEDVALVAPAVADQPLHFGSLDLQAQVDVDLVSGRLAVNDGLLKLGPAVIRGSALVDRVPDDPLVRVDLRLEPVSADAAFRAIPEALVSTIAGARFRGEIWADLRLEFQTLALSDLKLDFRPGGRDFAITSLGRKVRIKTLFGSFVHRLNTPTGRVRIVVGPDNEDFVPYASIPRWLVQAITTTEDGTFFDHDGFAGFAIRNSLVEDLERGAFVRGASTVSQQTVKNLFLSHEKTIARKIQEAIITFAMEQQISKERILEIYFNIIEWGPDLYGLGPAARKYFGRAPDELDLVDCLFLVSLIPAPRIYVREFRRGRISRNWRKRLEFYARKMVERGKIAQADYDRARPFEPIFRGRDVLDTLPTAPDLHPEP